MAGCYDSRAVGKESGLVGRYPGTYLNVYTVAAIHIISSLLCVIIEKLQFITLLTAIAHCFTHRKDENRKIIKVILLRAPCQNVNVLHA